MPSPPHDTLANRLAQILVQLNQGEPVCRYDLADRFGVSERTIYRDLNRLGGSVERLADGRYRLSTASQGALDPRDLEVFARLTGVKGLFPDSGHRFLRSLIDPQAPSQFLVKGHHHEDVRPRDRQFQHLTQAIAQHQRCHLLYGEKPRELEPYRLVNNKGIWYLAATENGQLKAFSLGRISLLRVGRETFTPCPTIARQIEEDDDIWFSTTKVQVRLSVAPAIAYYFLRRAVVPAQQVLDHAADGTLTLSSAVGHANQILPIIRYWMPHVRVLEPAWLAAQLRNELEHYLQHAPPPPTGSQP